MLTDVLAPDDARWQSCLEKAPHDFYQTPEYLTFCSKVEGGDPVAFWAEEGDSLFLLPVLKRSLPEDLDLPRQWSDAASPYGYPSLLMSPGTGQGRQARFLAAFLEYAQSLNLVSVFVRLHPLLETPQAALGKFGRLVRHGQTVFIDLTRPLAELQKETRENHRRGIRKLQKMDFKVVMDAWTHLSEFAKIYHLTMQRVEAEAFYFFGKEYFEELRRVLGERLHLCSVLSPRGELCAACLFTNCNEIIQYHLGATSPDYLKVAPSKLIFDAVRAWGKASGYRYFHLGGGLGAGEDSLFHFKAGFAKERSDFFTCRLIVDEEKYRASTRAWQVTHPGVPLPSGDGFFPAYRKP